MAYGSYYGGYGYISTPGVGGSSYSTAQQYENAEGTYGGAQNYNSYGAGYTQQSSGGNSGNSGGASSGLASGLGSGLGSALGSALAGAHQAVSGAASDANYAASGLNSLIGDVAGGNGQSAILLIGIIVVAFAALAMMQANRS